MATTENQRHLLITNRTAIIQDMRVRRILDILYSQGVLTRDDCERIEAESTNADRARSLLDMIPDKGYRAFRYFRIALQETYPHLAELLKGEIETPDSPVPEDELESILSMLVEGGVPQRPSVFMKRSGALTKLQAGLQTLRDQEGWVILHGMAGSGKTVLAAEAVRSAKLIRSCFPGGVFWVTVGQISMGELLTKMQNLCLRLDHDNVSLPSNIEAARDRLRITIARNHPRMLLILDDVWSWRILTELNLRCRTLVTTRDARIAERVGGHKVLIQLQENFTADQSKVILASWIKQPVSSLPKEADEIIDECKGSPLAISMIGALLQRRPDRWSYYLKLLKTRQVSKLRKSTTYQFSSLSEAIAISVDSLDEDLKKHYMDLAVFESNVKIPVSVLAVLWDEDKEIVEDYMDELVSKSLAKVFPKVHLDGCRHTMVYGLHDLVMDFLKEKGGDLTELHKKLIRCYTATCNGEFHKLPNDGYIYKNLVFHLLHANEIGLAKSVLTNLKWIEARLRHSLPSSLLNDYFKLRETLSEEEDETLEEFSKFIRTHSHLFVEKPQPDIIQLGLSQTGSASISDQAFENAQERSKNRFYLQWSNKPSYKLDKCLMSVRVHESAPACCNFSPDGSQIVSSSWEGDVKVFDKNSGATTASFDGHEDELVVCCCFSNDGRVATASFDETVKVWNINTGSLDLVYENHNSDVLWCEFSPNYDTIVSGGGDWLIRIWNSKTGQDYVTCSGHQDAVRQCSFSNDGLKVVSCSNDTDVKIWDATSGDLLVNCDNHDEGVVNCAFFDNDKMVMSASGRCIWILDALTGSPLHCFRCYATIYCCSVSNNNLYFAAGLSSSAIQVWDTKRQKTATFFKGHNGPVQSIAFSPDDSTIVSASTDETVKLWSSNVTDKVFRIKLKVFFACTFKNGEPTIYAADLDDRLRVYQGFKAKHHRICVNLKSRIKCICLSPDANHLAIGCENGEVMLFSCDNFDNALWKVRHCEKVTRRISFSKNQEKIVTGDAAATIRLICCKDGRLIHECHGHSGVIIYVAYIDQFDTVLSAARDETIKIWDATNGQLLHTGDNKSEILACNLAKNKSVCVTALVNKTVKLWDAKNGTLITTFEGYNDCVRSCRISNNCKWLATGCDDGSVKIWEIDTKKPLFTFVGHNGWVNRCKFSQDDNYLITISDSIMWWDLRKGRKLQEFRLFGRYACTIYCNDDFDTFVTIDYESLIYILRKIV